MHTAGACLVQLYRSLPRDVGLNGISQDNQQLVSDPSALFVFPNRSWCASVFSCAAKLSALISCQQDSASVCAVWVSDCFPKRVFAHKPCQLGLVPQGIHQTHSLQCDSISAVFRKIWLLTLNSQLHNRNFSRFHGGQHLHPPAFNTEETNFVSPDTGEWQPHTCAARLQCGHSSRK